MVNCFLIMVKFVQKFIFLVRHYLLLIQFKPYSLPVSNTPSLKDKKIILFLEITKQNHLRLSMVFVIIVT